MRTLLVFMIMVISSVSYAGGLKAKVASSLKVAKAARHASPVEVKHMLADGLEDVSKINFQVGKYFNGGVIKKTLPLREVGDAKVSTVVGHYKADSGAKEYFMEFNLSGYSYKEVALLGRLVEHHTGVMATEGARMGAKYDRYISLRPTKGVRNANELDKRLHQLGEALTTFYKNTDPKKDMINEVVAMRRSVYGTAAAN